MAAFAALGVATSHRRESREWSTGGTLEEVGGSSGRCAKYLSSGVALADDDLFLSYGPVGGAGRWDGVAPHQPPHPSNCMHHECISHVVQSTAAAAVDSLDSSLSAVAPRCSLPAPQPIHSCICNREPAISSWRSRIVAVWCARALVARRAFPLA